MKCLWKSQFYILFVFDDPQHLDFFFDIDGDSTILFHSLTDALTAQKKNKQNKMKCLKIDNVSFLWQMSHHLDESFIFIFNWHEDKTKNLYIYTHTHTHIYNPRLNYIANENDNFIQLTFRHLNY